MYDAIIVGARCAGSPTAMLLAQKGRRVLLVDRDTFPSDTHSTAWLRPDAQERLQRWGLRQRLVDAGTPEVMGTLMYALGMAMPTPAGPLPGMAPRRTVLDTMLVAAAREAGAEVREAFSIQEVLRDATGAVTGVRGQASDGTAVVEEARIVIGADGRNSFIARQVGAEEYAAEEPTACGFYGIYSGVEADTAIIGLDGSHFSFYFPTSDGSAYIGAECPIANWDEVKADPEAYLAKTFAAHAPEIGRRMAAGKREGKMLGMQGRRSFFRKPYGPGWALVGDAGYLKDPVLGTGVDDAFRDADYLAEALEAGFSGSAPLEEALASYHARRDAAVKDLYPVICEIAKMEPMTPERLGMFAMAQAVPA